MKLQDSLHFMSFYSPAKIIEQEKITVNLKPLQSPTVSKSDKELEDEEEEENLIIDETLVLDDDDDDCNNDNNTTQFNNDTTQFGNDTTQFGNEITQCSFKRSQSNSISESIIWSDNDFDDNDDDYSNIIEIQENKHELKRQIQIDSLMDTILKNENDLKNYKKSKSFLIKPIELNKNENWFCPYFSPPLPADLNSETIINNDPIVKYYKENKKFKVKLNLNIDTNLKEYQYNNNDNNELKWYTPAIPLPSVKKIKKKIIDNKLIQINKTIMNESDNMPVKSILKSNNDKKRKSVRFNEITQLLNENTNKQQDIGGEKCHLIVEEELIKNPIENNLILNELVDSCSNNSNDTCYIFGDENDSIFSSNSNSSSSNNVKQPSSSFEYNSILFPKTSKYIDCFDDMSTIIEKEDDEQSSSSINQVKKELKKDKKILNNDLPVSETSHLTMISMELHVNTRGNLHPNPDEDSIAFVCYTIYNQKPINKCLFDENEFENHLIIYDQEKRSLSTTRYLGIDSCYSLKNRFKSIKYCYKEEELFELFIQDIQSNDPDIFIGYELQKLSWCFLCRRAVRLGLNDFCSQISRLPKMKRESFMRINNRKQQQQQQQPQLPAPIPQELIIAGRVILNLWRILKSDINLNIYTFENCVYHILKERIPKYNFNNLNNWFQHRTDLYRWKTIEYYLIRSIGNLRLMSKLDTIGKTCEFAKVYGIEFYHVLSRGSQFRVESMMLRIARKLNYTALSCSQKQKSQMRAPECIPLTLEPESKFYQDPVAVLDFQSLYPSVIIAYNICFTTCLGRAEQIGKEGAFKFGCCSLFVSDALIKSLDLNKDIYVAPNGVAFVKKHVRVGILPILLEDILKTRVMIKNSMKLYKDDNLYKIFDSRQLSLKLIANVTFGYTGK